MASTYHSLDTVRISADFYLNNVLTDPTTVVLEVANPDGATIRTPVNDSVGKYSYTWIPTMVGKYVYKWTASGAVVTTGNGEFYVKPD